MTWSLSRFRVGDLVEVRSREEILATLDAHGCVEGLPFMPEMLPYCGRRFRVGAVAHKTCDTARKTHAARRLQATVHLEGLRCDGTAHGGCQADCNLFWKDVWLKEITDGAVAPEAPRSTAPAAIRCSAERLTACTRAPEAGPLDSAYSCQATRLFEASAPLAWWDPRQYARDVITGNFALGHVGRVLWLALLRNALERAPVGYRALRALRARMHRWLMGRETPEVAGRIALGQRTPGGRLDLKPGERVRIRTRDEIAGTLDVAGKNRGLAFDVEMTPYLGRMATVRRSVTRILDEATGTMLHMKEPCIILEDVVCNSEYSRCRLMCPRAIPSYWREIWLERVGDEARSDVGAETVADRSSVTP